MIKMMKTTTMTRCTELRISMTRLRHTSPISVSKCSSDRFKVEGLRMPICKNRREIDVTRFRQLRTNWLIWTYDLIVSITICYWTMTRLLKKNSSRDLRGPNSQENKRNLKWNTMMRMTMETSSMRTSNRTTTTVTSSTNNLRDNREETV